MQGVADPRRGTGKNREMLGTLVQGGSSTRTTVAAEHALNASAVEHCGMENARGRTVGEEAGSTAEEPSFASLNAGAWAGGSDSSCHWQICVATGETG